MMLFLQDVAYAHPNRDLLFANINLSINQQDKIALIGNNGSGKSTVLQILAGNALPSKGLVSADSKPYYVPQLFGQFNDSQELSQLRKELPDTDRMKMDFDNSALHKGKVLVTVKDINYGYGRQLLWNEALTFQITSGERIAIRGLNGSGKTTLIRIILGDLEPQSGKMERANVKTVYIDQDYSLIDHALSVYEQAQKFNSGALQEHDIRTRLNRYLFTKEYWDKPCLALSGGEKMRLMLCCLTIGNQAPDIMILDEPTNNLDIQNIEILTAAIDAYKGTLLVVSHDACFLQQIRVERSISLD